MEVINEGGLVKLWAEGVRVEDQAREQLKRVARLPFIHKWVAAMPDCHYGMGATIGSVIPTENVIMPAAVGVDIGCGIAGWQTNIHMSKVNQRRADLADLRDLLEQTIPHGRTDNGGKEDIGAWGGFQGVNTSSAYCIPGTIPGGVADVWDLQLADDYNAICEEDPKVESQNAMRHLGTLGTGNHFIEYAADQQGYVWILVHSGSRGPGASIANYWVRRAKELMKKWWIELEDPHLAYLPAGTPEFNRYINAMFWAQRYAALNRELMLNTAVDVLGDFLNQDVVVEEEVETPHNFVIQEHHFGKKVWVTRKGACKAAAGDRVVIPGSMGERSYVVTGKGNRDSFNSCSHGAGRAMSRTEARKRFDLEHHMRATEHVECRKDEAVLDETVGAYKDIDAVMLAQTDLVEATHQLRAFVNVKG